MAAKTTKAKAKSKTKTKTAKTAVRRKVSAKAQSGFNDFFDFFRNQGVVGLAIGFVVGTEVKNLVNVFTASYVSPVLGLIIPGDGKSAERTLTIAVNGKTAVFATGQFTLAVINFLIIMLIIYITYRWLKLDKLDKKD